MSAESVFKIQTGIEQEEIERVERMIGEPIRLWQYNREASIDSIRHYAYGLGDDNPLWCEPDYAATGPYGGIVAPPTFLYTIFPPGIAPGFDGLQAFHGTGKWTFEAPIERNTGITASATLMGMRQTSGGHAEKIIVQSGEAKYHSLSGEYLGKYESQIVRTPRANQEGGLRYEAQTEYEYSMSELEAIREQILGYRRRGAQKRSWSSVQVGDELGPLVKGPLDSTTLIVYYAGNLPYGYVVADLAWKRRDLAENAPERMPNNMPIGWHKENKWPGLGHHRPDAAASIGMPAQYDNGWMRIGWMSQLLTDWTGDAGWLRSLEVRLRAPNVLGDTHWLTGVVVGKDQGSGALSEVYIDVQGRNQRGDVTCTGTATALLPR